MAAEQFEADDYADQHADQVQFEQDALYETQPFEAAPQGSKGWTREDTMAITQGYKIPPNEKPYAAEYESEGEAFDLGSEAAIQDHNASAFEYDPNEVVYDPNLVAYDQDPNAFEYDPNAVAYDQDPNAFEYDPNTVTYDPDPNAVAYDSNAVAYDPNAVAYDPNAVAYDSNAVAYDPNAVAYDSNAVAYDSNAVAYDPNAVAYDPNAVAYDSNAVAYDPNAVAYDPNAVAYDPNAVAYDPNAVAYDPNAVAYDPNAVAYDPNAVAYDPNAIAYDPNAVAYDPNAVAYDPNAVAYDPNAVAYDPNAVAYDPNAVAYDPASYDGGITAYDAYASQQSDSAPPEFDSTQSVDEGGFAGAFGDPDVAVDDIEVVEADEDLEGRAKKNGAEKTKPAFDPNELRDLVQHRINKQEETVQHEGEGQVPKTPLNKFVGGKHSPNTQEHSVMPRVVSPEIRKACKLLGLRPEDLSKAVVLEAWKREMAKPGVHPDTGGDTEMAMYLNNAKDTLVRYLEAQAPKLGKVFGSKAGDQGKDNKGNKGAG